MIILRTIIWGFAPDRDHIFLDSLSFLQNKILRSPVSQNANFFLIVSRLCGQKRHGGNVGVDAQYGIGYQE